jgi:hypothetical protein
MGEPNISELESRMRPGAWSTGGFLGKHESLEDIIVDDANLLSRLNVTYQQLADKLERILAPALEAYLRREFSSDCPDLYNPEAMAGLTSALLLQKRREEKYISGNLQVFILVYRGMQHCPWECTAYDFAHFDFLILNQARKTFVTGPGLITHLIREHHFFEGRESPYRVDPAKLVYVLELAKH